MKVISIRQPWASLIINGYKKYEFRTWKTSFRGIIYIHASQQMEKNQLDRFQSLKFHYPTGVIIGMVEITDCVKVTKLWEDQLIEQNEFIYGATRNRTGYAFEMKQAYKFEKPIKVSGQLGIWNYYQESDIMNLMDSIDYGWVDEDKQKHQKVDEFFSDHYRLQNPREIMKSQIGCCFDQVELERFYFKGHEESIKTYFICYYGDKACPAHTFLTYEKNDSVYWFEHSFLKYRGIHKYSSLEELLQDVKEKFTITELDNDYDPCQLLLREYSKPQYGITTASFYQHCEKQDPIILSTLKDINRRSCEKFE